MSISDMIVVMKDGVVQQIGRPQDVYDDPHNLFVAKFLGTPPVNVFEGSLRSGKILIGEDEVFDIADLDPAPQTAGGSGDGVRKEAGKLERTRAMSLSGSASARRASISMSRARYPVSFAAWRSWGAM